MDLAGAVHPTVLPQLLTRRNVPPSRTVRRAAKLRAWRRRLGAAAAPFGEGPAPGPACRRKAAVDPRCGRCIACAGIASAWTLTGPQQAAAPEPARTAERRGMPLPADRRGPGSGGGQADWRCRKSRRGGRGLARLASAASAQGNSSSLTRSISTIPRAAAADARITGRLRDAGHVLAGSTPP